MICIRESIDELQKNGGSLLNGDISNFINENRQWQAQLLQTVYEKQWGADNEGHVYILSERLNASAELETKANFHRKILARLEYPEMKDCQENISKAYKDTFDWIYRDPVAARKPWASFVDWLQNENQSKIYWITGKFGSGKSTLMKYLAQDRRTMEHIKVWSQHHPLVITQFFFWNSGTTLQMLKMGLLQTLIYQAVQAIPNNSELLCELFEDRWRRYQAFGEAWHKWTWIELKRAIEKLVSDASRQLLFLIDGLDEFDGKHEELVDFVVGLSRIPNVKICVSSRPWLVFEDAFENEPSLKLEDVTFNDIKIYITGKFEQSTQYICLKVMEPDYALALIEHVVQKALGVFLWVHLVVQSLLQGLTNSDRVSDLERRLGELPSDLEALFNKIMNDFELFYIKHASQLIQIVRASREPLTLIGLSYADEEDSTNSLRAEVKPLSENERLHRTEQMRRRLNNRCKGLLECPNKDNSSWEPTVQYLHRTVKDYLEEPSIWNKVVKATDDGFNPNRSLCNSFLMQLKTTNADSLCQDSTYSLGFLTPICRCLECELQFENQTGQADLAYLDEVNSTAAALWPQSSGQQHIHHSHGWDHWTGALSRPFTIKGIEPFVAFAAGYGLLRYVRAKIDQMQPQPSTEQLSQILEIPEDLYATFMDVEMFLNFDGGYSLRKEETSSFLREALVEAKSREATKSRETAKQKKEDRFKKSAEQCKEVEKRSDPENKDHVDQKKSWGFRLKRVFKQRAEGCLV